MNAIPKLFRFLCLVTAICMCIYCTYEFSKNQDFSEISFLTFNEDEMSVYPQISWCFWDQFSDYELKKINKEFNSTSYSRFLKGHIWDSRMANVDIQKVTPKLENRVLNTCVQSSVFGNCENKGDISTRVTFIGTKCLSFHYHLPRRIFSASMWFNSSGILKYLQNSLFILSYPDQIYRITSLFAWSRLVSPKQQNSSAPYEMHFQVKDVEVIRRRNKREKECIDWKNSDSIQEKQVLSYVGCRPFYLSSMERYPMCDTSEKMALIHTAFTEAFSSSPDVFRFTPPCSEIQRINAIYSEVEINSAVEIRRSPKTNLKFLEDQGWLRITVEFRKNEFKEIKQLRAYSAQSLIGNAGGYVGLFIGYTIAELPSLFGMLYRRLMAVLEQRLF